MDNIMDSDLSTQEAQYSYSTSYSRTVRTTVVTEDENGVVRTQQSTVTTDSSNPRVRTVITSGDRRKNQMIGWAICLVTLVVMGILCAVSFVIMFRVSLFFGMVMFGVGSVLLPTIMIVIGHKIGYRTRGHFRIGGLVKIVDKSRQAPSPAPPQCRAMSRTSIISSRLHAPTPVGTTNVQQNFGNSQFQTQTFSVNYPSASNTQGYQTNPGYENQQGKIWAQPVGYQGYSQQPSSGAYPPPPQASPYADPPPSYESATR